MRYLLNAYFAVGEYDKMCSDSSVLSDIETYKEKFCFICMQKSEIQDFYKKVYQKFSYLCILIGLGTLLLFATPQPAFAESYIYEDTVPATLDDVTTDLCLHPLVRTFVVSDSFMVENLLVGFNASHTFRADVRLVLYSPQGTKVEILTEFYEYVEDESLNYDILLDASSSNAVSDGDDDNPEEPYYDRTVRPTNSLTKFNGENALGEWRLEICDAGIGDGGIYNRSQLQFAGIPIPPTPPSNQISGVAFQDANADGIRNDGEKGIGQITIYAYAENNMIANAVTDEQGRYTLAVPNDLAVRLEFADIPTYLRAGAHGANSATTVALARSPARAVDVAFNNPGQFCQPAADTRLVTSCFYFGAHDGTFANAGTVLSFAESDGSNADVALPADASAYDPTTMTKLATQAQTGAVWGVTYSRRQQMVYVASLVKRHSDLGVTGNPTTIYAIDPATNTSKPWFTLDATRLNPHVGVTNWDEDFAVFDQVGKEGWGDLDIAEDERELYAIDLGRRQLVIIPLTQAGEPGAITTVDLLANAPADLIGAGATQCPAPDLRPFGLGVHNGVVYVGMVCTAQSTVAAGSLPIQAPTSSKVAGQRPGASGKLRGYVFAWDRAAATSRLSTVLNFSLDYTRGCVTYNHEPGCEERYDGHWSPWIDTFPFSTFGGNEPFEAVYPQPLLSDIEFYNDDMILFLGDRFGHQVASYTASPHSTGLTNISISSDILYACKRSDGWVMEELISGDTSCGTAGQGFVRGVERVDEYFFEDTYRALYLLHDDIGMGAGVVIPGRNTVMAAVIDPIYRSTINETNFDAGFHWYSVDDGHWRKAVRLYDGDGSPQRQGFLQKAAGLGDITALCDPAPLEVGNRVWLDSDGDGVQDGDEPGIANVTVMLLHPGFGPDGLPATGDETTPLATVQTNGDGGYYFSSGVGINAPDAIYELPLQSDMAYRICLPNVIGANQQSALNQHRLTVADAFPLLDRADWRDADGQLVEESACVDFTTGAPGHNDHTFDFGFYQTAAIGDFTWLDQDRDGIQDHDEAGVGGITVQLCDATGAIVAETVSDASGHYRFVALTPGTYGVAFLPPTGYVLSPATQGGDSTQDSDALPTGRCTMTTELLSGEFDPTWDAGFYVLYDWGDLPDTAQRYPTRGVDAGPHHLITPGFYLGSCVDAEEDGQPSAVGSATADDTGAGQPMSGAALCNDDDDEDGVSLTTPVIAGADACVAITASQSGHVNAFIDFAGGGALVGIAFTRQDGVALPTPTLTNLILAGRHEYCFGVPALTGHAGLLYSRFRLSRLGGLGATGSAPTGEVEDYVQPLACVGNFVWADRNGDGRQAADEPGLANVTVQLRWGGADQDLHTQGDNLLFTTKTDAQGEYHFCGLLPTTAAAYQLFLPMPPGQATRPDAANDDSYDSDGNQAGESPTFGAPLPLATVDSAPNDQSYEGYTDLQDDLSFDFGFYQTASVGNLVWLDLNMNGRQDNNEPGVANIVVKLYSSDGLLVGQVTTDADGHYQFVGLPPGEYMVEFMLPPAFMFSPVGADEESDEDSNVDPMTRQTTIITLQSGDVNLTWDAGIFQLPTHLPDADEPGPTGRTLIYLPLVQE